jgi:cell division protein FtsI (penicillin-binding protein 3)
MMLRNVVEKPWGTANNIYDENIKIAGKTGTSQIDYTSEETQYVSSFVGYFPSDKPKYSAIVVINKPKKSKGYYGNSVAAPVFKNVAKKIIIGIPNEIQISKKETDILF